MPAKGYNPVDTTAPDLNKLDLYAAALQGFGGLRRYLLPDDNSGNSRDRRNIHKGFDIQLGMVAEQNNLAGRFDDLALDANVIAILSFL